MRTLLTSILLCVFFFANGQKPTLEYYLPEIKYDKKIPTPESILGYQIGEWHISHDQLLKYMYVLAEASPRVTLSEHGRTYENRPLIHLTITSEKNHEDLEEIKAEHRSLSDPGQSEEVNASKQAIVLYQGFSIHGNEPSGVNASVMVAYYLAAGKSKEVEKMLEDMVILFDPCLNPDGVNRFANWVNIHKSKNLSSDPQDREFNEVWPRGRTNHYWFDLNRDWMPAQHPESKGRLALFYDWKPNVLTDHHEMGANSTFFFMPGAPNRNNPNTPPKNQELTAKIGEYHAAALDGIGSLYFSQENFDDFYIGKGSTFPDVNGCIGILFEQASSRGLKQETENGMLTFPFTIRNQITTALSTQKATLELKDELLQFQKDFYVSALEEASSNNIKAFLFGESKDAGRLGHLVEILRRQNVKVYKLAEKVEHEGQIYLPSSSYVVPLNQVQYRFINAVFQKQTSFKDSIFYDISAWTLPLAFNIPYADLDRRAFSENLIGEAVEGLEVAQILNEPDYSEYAYLFEWDDYYAPKALNYLLKKGLRAKVGMTPFIIQGRFFERGTIMIPAQNQGKSFDEIHLLMQEAGKSARISIFDVDTGLSPEGIDLGSGQFEKVALPKVLLLVGDGASSLGAGEVWHLLDQRYDMELTMAEAKNINRLDLSRYNNIVMVDGSYSFSGGKVKEWVGEGGTLIVFGRAISWAKSNGLAQVTTKKTPKDKTKAPERKSYEDLRRNEGSKAVGGAIFEAEADLGHPLLFGYHSEKMPVFHRGSMFLEPAKNAYATPLVYTNEPLLAGYINKENKELIRNSASIIVGGYGSGKVICLADNTNFRAFWFGTNKIFANALFFAPTISSRAVERVVTPAKKQE